ncbi:hypothetical protein F511_01567 [Dorcoceras hygrometricum]|nr:hypothetical protein F511_01567 [Dorcoceras hygrometricum]
MGSLVASDISLDFRFLLGKMGSSIGRVISQVLRDHNSPSERISQLAEYIDGLEAEKRKIEAFKRELPRCMLLLETKIKQDLYVDDDFLHLGFGIVFSATVAVKEEMTQCERSNAVPVLEEFMPLKKIADEKHEKTEKIEEKDNKGRDKMNWMSSVQLWNSGNQHFDDKRTLNPDNIESCKNRIAGTTSWSLVKDADGDESALVPGLSLGTPKANNPMDEINSSAFSSKSSFSRCADFYTDNQQSQQITRKQRRCWSPELHRRFVDALQQLGGAQAATPKQIRELMRVEGLSNDEVKSHLQKYRIHTRRVRASTSANHPIVLGASWMLSQKQHSESSKHGSSRSGSPKCHPHLAGFSRGTSFTGGESMEDEDEEKSVSRSWKNEIQLSLGDNDDVKLGKLCL